MPEPERQTASRIRRLLQRAGVKPRRRLGQNFLVDLNLLDVIIEAAELSPGDVVLEVGTGTGSLTARLAERARRVIAVEYDPLMARLTAESVAGRENVVLLNQDVLENKNHLAAEVMNRLRDECSSLSDNHQAVAGDRCSSFSLKLVANLPYHVATPVISNLIATDLAWSRMVVTIQWELAQRMTAKPRTPDYSALSVWLQSQCRLEILRRLPPDVFWPKPEVDSAIVRIDCDIDRQRGIADRAAFHDFLRDVFTQRRKHLIGVVGRQWGGRIDRAALEAIHQELGLPLDVRAEALPVETLVKYHNRLAR